MSNGKGTLQDLVNEITNAKKINHSDAELFVKDFFQLIQDVLEADKYLKIKDFGVFKIVDIESRESINVNTGERIIIKGHSKISFTPDTQLRDSINEPFAYFETVILNDDVVFDENIENADNDNSEDDESAEFEGEKLNKQEINNKTTDTEAHKEEQDESDNRENEEYKESIESLDKTLEQSKKEEIKDNESLNTELISEENKTTEIQESKIKNIHYVDENIRDGEKLDSVLEEDKEKIITAVKDEAKEQQQILKTPEEIIIKEISSSQENFSNYQKSIRKRTKKTSERLKRISLSVLFIILLAMGGFIIYWLLMPEKVEDNKHQSKTPQDFSLTDSIDKAIEDTAMLQNAVNEIVDSVRKQSNDKENDTTDEDVSQSRIPLPEVMTSHKKTQQPILRNQIKSTTNKKVGTEKIKITGLKTTHILKKGENLNRLALKYLGSKDKVEYIIKYNHLKNPNTVKYGAKILIPQLSE